MATLSFGLNQSLDGFVDHDRFGGGPDPVLFRHFIERTKEAGGCLYGRRLYENMRYWDGDDWDQEDSADTDELREYAEAWRALPKWVVSTSLRSVGPNATLLTGDLETQVRRLKDDVRGELDVGGPALAHSLTELGLIDSYDIYLHPVVLGTGQPFFAGPIPPLQLAGTERIGDDVIRLTYRPRVGD